MLRIGFSNFSQDSKKRHKLLKNGIFLIPFFGIFYQKKVRMPFFGKSCQKNGILYQNLVSKNGIFFKKFLHGCSAQFKLQTHYFSSVWREKKNVPLEFLLSFSYISNVIFVVSISIILYLVQFGSQEYNKVLIIFSCWLNTKMKSTEIH